MSSLPPCPHLPTPRPGLSWRTLHFHRGRVQGEEFYRDCLEYAHALWQRGQVARSVLCLDRAFGADLRGNEDVLREWPLPYAALVWIIENAPVGVYLGNLRVHYQHYAGRMNEPRCDQRRWRAWACWALVRIKAPDSPGDPNLTVSEPTFRLIGTNLEVYGVQNEAKIWAQYAEDQFAFERAGR